MTETMMTLFFGHPEIDFRYQHTRNGLRFNCLRHGWGGRTAAPAEIVALRASLQAGLRRIGAA